MIWPVVFSAESFVTLTSPCDAPGDLVAAESGRLRRADPFLFVFHVKRFLIFSCFLCLYYSVRKSENQGKKY